MKGKLENIFFCENKSRISMKLEIWFFFCKNEKNIDLICAVNYDLVINPLAFCKRD